MAENSPDYHLAELKRAREQGGEALPKIPADVRRVLDVGCGAGQTLLVCAPEVAQAFGVDFDFDALRLGRELKVPAGLVQASGEQLPFRSGSFDFLYSRVALPYMDIPVALAEFARVLEPGGRLWITLHPLSMLEWRAAFRSPRRAAFELYRLANTMALHFFWRQFRYPLRRSRTESYQTNQGIHRILQKTGFGKIRLHRTGQQFGVSAQRNLEGI